MNYADAFREALFRITPTWRIPAIDANLSHSGAVCSRCSSPVYDRSKPHWCAPFRGEHLWQPFHYIVFVL